MVDTAPGPGLILFNRFGMGARPGDLAGLRLDPRAALKAELAKADVALVSEADASALGLMSTTPNIQAAYVAQAERSLDKKQAEDATRLGTAPRAALGGIGSDAVAEARPNAMAMTALRPPAKPGPRIEQTIYNAEALARIDMATRAEIGFVERLVAFWSNHFCVSVRKGDIIRVTAGSFEREAIRPNVLGSFLDMLMAVEHHPAMLYFLDNNQSIGPDSIAGQRQKRGLNENLAREIMELHTLGVGSGYAQADVTSLARVLTGWTYAGREGRQGEPGSFVFNVRAHEPGDQMVIGKAYLQGGLGQGEAALTDLARHPATAHHIATKLARHFIADDPPPAIVDRLAKVFRDRDGDLRALAVALIDSPEAWSVPLTKIRNPYDVAMASARLSGAVPQDAGPSLAIMRNLGMPLWEVADPNGYPDTEAAWGSPEEMKLRLDLSVQIAHGVRSAKAPLDMLDDLAGQEASAETRLAVSRAESREQAMALLLMSPEFQRR
ncbi:DUF1800 family protein [Lichenihabitans sp. PAMC28606]|uniref:DUF1800 domain-containing protein n=1 Tax=Lichenihabitans sp. PAMC28606 TaxID=2880932 RepID=UPI001D09BA58|nr:DUF1800 family protein [Lichenihabitans sp. PAMC28606]UDL96301.1 DUF1800 family protein [Lichenihabitans sp. PAMC28606]